MQATSPAQHIAAAPGYPAKPIRFIVPQATGGSNDTMARFMGHHDLPAIAESGLPGYESSNYRAIATPAGTPPAMIKRLSSEK